MGYTPCIVIQNKAWNDDEKDTFGWHGSGDSRFGFGDGGGPAAGARPDLHQGADDGAGVQLDRMLCRRQCRRPVDHQDLVDSPPPAPRRAPRTSAAGSPAARSVAIIRSAPGCSASRATMIGANASGTAADASFVGGTDHSNVKSLASVTGRVGYTWDRFLGYVKGGGAWVKRQLQRHQRGRLGRERERDPQRLDPRGRRRIRVHRLAERVCGIRLL